LSTRQEATVREIDEWTRFAAAVRLDIVADA
jgi:hypothetical protein